MSMRNQGRVDLRVAGEEVYARVKLPEMTARHKHSTPSLGRVGVQRGSDSRVSGCDQTHTFQLLHQLLSSENTFAVDVDAPFTFGSSGFNSTFGYRIGDLLIGLGLLKVPVKSGP